MPVNQYPLIRQWFTCANCQGAKDKGLLLCWQCHHNQKMANDGTYSAKVERELANLERLLSS